MRWVLGGGSQTDRWAERGTFFVRCVAACLGLLVLWYGARTATRVGSEAGAREATLSRRPILRPSTHLAARENETLEAFLRRGGLSSLEAGRIGALTAPYLDGVTGEGVEARFHAWPGDPPEAIDLSLGGDLELAFEIEGATWDAAARVIPVTHDTVVVSGRVEDSLWGARLEGDEGRLTSAEKGQLPGHLADVFAWQVDFFRDVRSGDRFRLAIERAVRSDGSIRGGRVLAAEWVSQDRRLEAYRFGPSDEAVEYFYDAEGTALRGAFLKAPLDLVRITSRFSDRRFHPVLGRYRSHNGIDYGAAPGTPVRVTGDGRVVRAGLAGDFGLLVEVEHSSGIRTRYAHLSGIAPDVTAGARVAQGAVIGLVGSTGLATGPHLHYEFLLNGRAVDPASVDLPVERPLPDADQERFTQSRFAAAALLRRARFPSVSAAQ